MSKASFSYKDFLKQHLTGKASYLVAVSLFAGVLFIILTINTHALWVMALKSSEHEKVILDSEAAKELSLRAQLNFKKQVQEWKNVLLRGSDPELKVKYFQQFEQQEAIVFRNLEALLGKGVLSAQQRLMVSQLVEELEHLSGAYRAAIEKYDLSVEGAYGRIDLEVRGIDREPTREMESLVVSISDSAAERIIESAHHIESVRSSALLQCFGSALVGLVLIGYYIRERYLGELAMADAVRRAEAASEAKSAFLANISHEIRTPLNGVLGMAQLLEGENLNTYALGHVKTLRQSGEHLLGLLNDVLDYSELESGTLALVEKQVNLPDLFSGIVKAHKEKALAKGLVLKLSLSDQLPEAIMGDSMRMRQVVSHLIDNAIKFTHKGTVVVSVAWHEAPRNEASALHIEVKDTGVGIPTNRLPDLFAAFTQVDESDTRRYGGTGLGLSICKALCEKMGGDIHVSSKEGKGSLFLVRLGIREKVQIAQSAPDRIASKKHHGEALLKGIRVLVADDNRVNQRVVSLLLKRYGAEVSFASNGQEAVELGCDVLFPLVLMDLQMPIMDGFEATKLLKKQFHKGGHPYIIALTAAAGEHDRMKTDRVGFDGYLTKPLEAGALEAELRKFIAGLGELKRPLAS